MPIKSLISNLFRPMPTFEDVRKMLSFWFDQQDKYYYFETDSIDAGEFQKEMPVFSNSPLKGSTTSVNRHRIQEQIIGKIHDILTYPPSIVLTDVTVEFVDIEYSPLGKPHSSKITLETQDSYGLVLSRIKYFEKISPQTSDEFMETSSRWK